MKKLTVIVLLVLLITVVLAGCDPKYTPDPAVEQYLNSGLTGEKAYAAITKAGYIEYRTIQDKQGNIKGTYKSEVQIDKSDKDNLFLSIHQQFTGEYVENSVEETTSTLTKGENGYVYTVVRKLTISATPTTNSEQMETSDAEAFVQSIVYSNNEVYDEGLYYGDLFMLRIYRYPAESFYIDEDNLCVFDAKIYIRQDSTGNIKLYQTTKINELGLLVYNYEKYESVSNDYVMTCEIIPTYEYATTAV